MEFIFFYLLLTASEARCSLRLSVFLASNLDIIGPEVPQETCSHEGKRTDDSPLHALRVNTTRIGPAQSNQTKYRN